MSLSLTVEKREKKVPSGENINGVLYGPKQESIPVSFERKAFLKIFDTAGFATIVTLEGLGEAYDVLIHDVAYSTMRREVHHVDFYAIERGKDLTTEVPLHFVGEAPVEKKEGVLNKVLHEVTITCKPKDLISSIEVDISTLADFEDIIRIKDLVVPKTIKIEHEDEETVVGVSRAREEEPEEEVEAVAAADVPTVDKKETEEEKE